MNEKAPPKEPETPQKPETGEPTLRRPDLVRPGIFFLLLLIPLAMALFSAFYENAALVAPPAPVAVKPAPQVEWRGMTGKNSGSGRGTKKCRFRELTGHKPDQNVLSRIRAAGTVYRILPPGAVRTMDYNEDRINLDVDADGVITRVWCG